MKKIICLLLVATLSNCSSFSKRDLKKVHNKVSKLKTLDGTYNLQPSKSLVVILHKLHM